MTLSEHRLCTLSRRQFFRRSGLGLGSAALAALLHDDTLAAARPANPLAARPPMFPPRARHVIYLHMIGAPSQLDLFDDKPELRKRDGQECPESLLRGRRFTFIGGKLKLDGRAGQGSQAARSA